MGDVLAQLEDALRSKPPKDKSTAAMEEEVLQRCKVEAIKDLGLGVFVSSAVAWTASRSLTYGQRFNLSVGSAILVGMWRFNRSLNECLEHILGINGSRMQRELAKIILTKHQDNVSRVKLMHKYFYAEEVFNDVNPDHPVLRWRSRNFYNEATDRTAIHRTGDAVDRNIHEKPDVHYKQPTRSPAGDMIADPLDCIFGSPDTSKEIAHSDKTTLPRRRVRAHKKAHRHHRAQDSESQTDH